ncbi:hypothetical protein [Novosphingobium resinovorum]|uniref:Uncharacterized protein n=1 Tax=Novosphingobium resinovorum TaxID=158500 RepID=A0A1D8A526_9SPHN|nr:hypothetical protein [Novosphingobium resinovorum]AOR77217.1 hypothetical protein BES08_10990 [Novosphingobium resinovorum]
MREPQDLSGDYNTQLSPEDEAKFQAWAKASGRERDTFDYDLRGAWKDNAQEAANGHLPDTYKKPNHPTFSQESKYSTHELQGGRWVEKKSGKWAFVPSSTNLKNMGVDGLSRYFQEREPDAELDLPAAAQLYPNSYSK